MKKIILALIIGLLAVGLSACGEPDEIDISSYQDKVVKIVGLTEKPVELSVLQMKNLEPETIKTESTSDKIGVVRATGVWLDDILEPYGITQADIKKLTIEGSDEYDTRLYNDYLKDNDIMLCYGIDGEPLDEESKPCRIIIKKSDSAYWVRKVTKITIEK